MEKDLIILFLALLMLMCYIAILYYGLFVQESGTLIIAEFFPKQVVNASNDGYECELNFNKTLKFFIGKDDYLISNLVLKDKKETVGE